MEKYCYSALRWKLLLWTRFIRAASVRTHEIRRNLTLLLQYSHVYLCISNKLCLLMQIKGNINT